MTLLSRTRMSRLASSAAWPHALRRRPGDMLGTMEAVAALRLGFLTRVRSCGPRTQESLRKPMLSRSQSASAILPSTLRLFYLLFLPLIRIVLCHGVRGAALGVPDTQPGLIASTKLTVHSALGVRNAVPRAAYRHAARYNGHRAPDKRQATTRKVGRSASTLCFAIAGEMASTDCSRGQRAAGGHPPLGVSVGPLCDSPITTGVRFTLRQLSLFRRRPERTTPRPLRESFRTGTSPLERVSISELVSATIEPTSKACRTRRLRAAPKSDEPGTNASD